MKLVKRYVPELVHNFIKNSHYKNADHLYVICDMLNRITIYRKEDDNSKEFRDIPQKYFTEIISNYEYFKAGLDFLESNNIISCDGISSKDAGKAFGYKFNNEFISKLISVQLQSMTIVRKLIKNVNESRNAVSKKFKSYKNYFLKNFKIDFEGANKWLENWFNDEREKLELGQNYSTEIIQLINKYNRLFISINAINDGDLFFRKNETNGRIDTNLTSLKKEFKKFISIDNLFQVDIKNSQPYFLSTILYSLLCSTNHSQSLDTIEIQKFQKWCSDGNLYEKFSYEYEKQTGKTLTRSQIKEIMFCIFYSKNNSYRKEKSIFKTIFPTILAWIEKQKEKNHNQFSIRLQKIESEICIDEILPLLEEANIEYFTIHDSWLVKKEDLNQAIKIIENKFMEKFGYTPKLDIEDVKNPDKKEATLFEKPKQKILYKGYKEVEIDEITEEDKKLFLEKVKFLETQYFGVSEEILIDLRFFDKYKTSYMYEKLLKSEKWQKMTF